MYSKLTRIVMKDFMSFPSLDIAYPEEGILNIKGFNDSGKSALMLGAAVCLMNAYPNKQKSFIRDTTDHFRVVCSFSDGVDIVREKYTSGASLYEMYQNGELVYTTREGDALTNVEDIPRVVLDYLGLCEEEGFFLNMRRRTDKMLLADTSGSENFKLLNQVLKSSELSSAAAKASKKVNEIARDLRDLEAEYRLLESQLSDLWSDLDTLEGLEMVQERIDTCEGTLGSVNSQLTSLQGLDDLNLDCFAPLDDLPDLDDRVLRLVEELESVDLPDVPPELPEVTLPVALKQVGMLMKELEGLSDTDWATLKGLPDFREDLLIDKLLSTALELVKLEVNLEKLEQDMDKCPECGRVL